MKTEYKSENAIFPCSGYDALGHKFSFGKDITADISIVAYDYPDVTLYENPDKLNEPDKQIVHGNVRLIVALDNTDSSKPVFNLTAFFARGSKQYDRDLFFGADNPDFLMKHSSLMNDEEFCVLYRLWKLYNCNDMHAGTPKQETALKKAANAGILAEDADCFDARDYLRTLNLDKHRGHEYGKQWLYQPIKASDLKIIKQLVA